MNTVLFQICDTPQQAQQIVQRLLDAGLTRSEIGMIGTATPPDQEARPQFHHTEHQGSFADVDPSYHDRHAERQGSFADVEPDDQGHNALLSTLVLAGLAPNNAETCAAQIQRGATLVLARPAAHQADQAAAILRSSR